MKKVGISKVIVMGKFWQSLATFGSEWNGNRVGFIYRLGKLCHVWPKTCHDPPFSKNFLPRNRVTFWPACHNLAMSKGNQF